MALTPDQLVVIIPTFNCAENLPLCLSALLEAKGESDFDIFVIDNGSTDETSDSIKQFDIKYIKTDYNLGQSWARNHGAEISKSEYILFIDSDVIVQDNCIYEISEFITMDKPKELIGLQGVFSLSHPFKDWPSLIYNTLQHLLSRKPYFNYNVNTSLLLINRKDFIDIGKFREDIWFMEDNEFSQRMKVLGKYVLHGPIQFVHRKKITWKWLFRSHFLGGKMQYVLSTINKHKYFLSIPSKNNPGVNHVFINWLFAGISIFLLLISIFFIPNNIFKAVAVLLEILVIFKFASDCLVLWKVKANPFFLITGFSVFMIIPWFIVFGRLMGRYFGPSNNEHMLWMKRPSSTK